MDSIAEKNADRFTGFADTYEENRPKMPFFPVKIIKKYLGRTPETVIDLGSGTGLSAEIWKGNCTKLIGVEASEDMLASALKKQDESTVFIRAFAHNTGLKSACADAVVCSQSFHWMEPKETLAEIDRILKNEGVFAAVDCDWPPVCNWRAESAYNRLFKKVTAVEQEYPELRDSFVRWEKSGHLANIEACGYFQYAREIVFSNSESCGAERYVNLALSQGGLQSILKSQPHLIQEDIGEFRQAVYEAFENDILEIEFCYRMRIGVR